MKMTLARQATPTVTFVDEYCREYQDLFADVRSFEHFSALQVGMLSEIKRKTLPAIAKATRDRDPQALHHFVAYAPMTGGRAASKAADLTAPSSKGETFYALY
jgi:SRSO17 transposase